MGEVHKRREGYDHSTSEQALDNTKWLSIVRRSPEMKVGRIHRIVGVSWRQSTREIPILPPSLQPELRVFRTENTLARG